MSIRASDDDRERIVAALEQHTGAGRLTLDEFAERAQVAHAARTLGELAAVVHDLPAPAQAGPPQAELSQPPAPRRELLMLLAVAALTLLILGLFMALSRG